MDANAEVANIGRALTHIVSTAVFHAGSNNPNPAYAPQFSSYGNITDFDGNNSGWTIGFFEDVNDEEYFMIVNNEHHEGASAASCSRSCSVTFDSSINSLQKIDRETGGIVTINLTNHVLNLTLPGGTGDLFKYNTGQDFIKPLCGDYGYDASDINRDCVVDLTDFAMIASVWLQCSHNDSPSCHNYYDCQANPGLCRWLEENWRYTYMTTVPKQQF